MAASIWLLATLTVGHVVFPGALAECTWKEVKGTSIPGGSDVLAFSLSECQSACLQKDGCQSIDYDTEGICALHKTQDGQQPTPDSSHFDYICEATSTIRPQPSTSTKPQVCKTKLDLVFVVDGSTSICHMPITTCNNWKFNLQFIHKIIDDQTIGPDDTRVGLVMFSDEAHVEFNLNKYTDEASLLSVIDNLRYPKGQTNTTGALKTLVSTAFTPAAGDRPDVPNVSILITDGNPTREVDGLPAAIKLVKTSGIHMLVVDVSKNVKNISSILQEVNKTYFMAKDYSSIDLVRIELLKQTCSLGVPTTTQPRPATTTQPRPTELPVCKAKLDLVFVVDGSKSICSPYLRSACLNWVLNRQFIHKIVDAQTIGRDHTRVGVVIFSETARVAFNLNKYTDETSLLAAIDSLRVPLGGTNTTGALKTLVSAAFTPAAGDRPDVPNVSILITDGIPTIDVEELPAAIKQVEASGIHMLAVGVTKMVDEATVRNLSSAPHQINVTYFLANDYSSIELVLGQLQKQACIV